MVIGLAEREGYLLNRDDPSGRRNPLSLDEYVSVEDAFDFALDVARVELDLSDSREELPNRLGFLEMFDAKNVEHLNIAARWRESNASDTLAASIGLDALGDPFVLNLHEDFHGPHGLIAGTTGSGKSEFIITYILSMAVNYSPEDVAFVLIDYKGGGLAKAFDNERMRLPHVAGTITNLDGAAIARSLVSIKSELQRRQRLFNETREVIGGDNVDIYKYLDLFRQGRVSEPCPHLIIVADEFAELKQQEPEFMDELISAARIGRSLGVHLILATQKPTGVVNDQIWSNARFKVCLKVADAADSQEIIRRPDAAEITQAGRFFLMVGYNEYFALGQSGYTGVPYDPEADEGRARDESVEYVSDLGRVLLSVKPRRANASKECKSEIVTLLDHIAQVADEQGKRARQLWLDPLPGHIEIDEIQRKFGFKASDDHDLNPVIGMYDNPSCQTQGLLTLPLMQGGGAIIYGASDSGVESILQTMLHSLVKTHTARTFNAYVFDFGSQSLTSFAAAPQVGDVILVNDEEKVRRFFDYMARMISERRSLFAPYGGSFARYCEKAKGCPAILVVVNGMSTFLEAYDRYEEVFVGFARDAAQVGIRLVVTAEGLGAVRMRIRNSFRQILACDLADSGDYMLLFGSMRGIPQPHGFARGLVKVEDDILEFQGASVCAEDVSSYDFIAGECAKLAAESDVRAPSVPVAPERVSIELVSEFRCGAKCIPFGVYDDTLEVASFDFSDSPIARCCFQKRKDGARFLSAFLEANVNREGWDIAMLDLSQILNEQPHGCVMATRKDEYAQNYLLGLMGQQQGVFDRNLLVVVSGMADFLNRCPFDVSSQIRAFLKALASGGATCFLFVDAVSDNSFVYEDWFKAHLTNKDGLWIGAGVDGQSAIIASYNARFLDDSKMDGSKGYAIEGGHARFAHVVASENEMGES